MKTCERCGGSDFYEKEPWRCRTCHLAGAKARRAEARAAKGGWSPVHDMTHTVPEGFRVKGVSTLYGGDGAVAAQWVKTAAEDDRLAALAEACQAAAEPLRGVAYPVEPPADTSVDLMCVYPMGDPHVGMYSWWKETGQSFDLDIAERNLVAAVDHLVDLAPPSDEALVVDLGDFFHSDTLDNKTRRSGHALDVDTRWAKVLRAGVHIVYRIIDRCLDRHARVRFVAEIGNHDDQSSIMLATCVDAYYAREPRVSVDMSPAKFHWHRFGKSLVGITHGDTVKMAQLGGIMAADRPQDWGETLYRYWYTGHVHHDRLLEMPGCVAESFRTLSPRDAYSASAGYRSDQDMKCDVFHREWGRINRHQVGIRQIWKNLETRA